MIDKYKCVKEIGAGGADGGGGGGVNPLNLVWQYPYEQSLYPKNTQTIVNGWFCVSNKSTSDIPYPQFLGDKYYLGAGAELLPEPSLNTTQLVFGEYINKITPYGAFQYRFPVVAGNEYEVIIVRDPFGAKEAEFINRFTADTNEIKEFDLITRTIKENTPYALLTIVTQPDPSPAIDTAQYDYLKPSAITIPLSGQMIQSSKELGKLYTHYTDNLGADKTATIQALVPGGRVNIDGQEWSVQSVEDFTSYAVINVAPALQLPTTGIKTVEFETPAPVTITYYKDTDFFLGNTETRGLLAINDSWENVSQTDDFYGMDILVQDAVFSEDWDVEPIGGAGGGVGLPNPARLNSYLPVAEPYTTPTLVATQPTKLLVPTTVKASNSFTLDVGNSRYFFDSIGRENVEFSVESTMGLSSSSTNHTVDVELWKNGVREEGVGISRFIASGADLGAIGITGTVILSHNDYIEFYITNSTGGTVTLSRLSININEKLGAV